MLRIGVIGVGYFGRHHVRILSSLDSIDLIGVVDCIPERAKFIGEKYGTPFYTHHHQIMDKVEAVVIAVPTVDHYTVTRDFLNEGIDVLVEKPITKTLKEADGLIDLAHKKGATLQVGFLERLNPAFEAATPIIRDPRFIETYRIGTFVPRSLDIDVVLDLMIHDIDIVLSIVKSPLKVVHAAGVPVLTKEIDMANARLEFDSGCVVNLTASRVNSEKIRKVRIFQSDTYISLDYTTQEVSVSNLIRDPKTNFPTIQTRRLKIEKEEPLKKELKSFIYAVENGTEVVVSGQDARLSMEVAMRVLEKI